MLHAGILLLKSASLDECQNQRNCTNRTQVGAAVTAGRLEQAMIWPVKGGPTVGTLSV